MSNTFKKFLHIIAIILLACTMLFNIPKASAVGVCDLTPEEMKFYAKNNILYYCPKTKGGSSAGNGCFTQGDINISGSTVIRKIWNGLTTFLTPEQAAGVMGNMQSESNFNPAQHEIGLKNEYQPGFDLGNNSSVSYGLGLCQWSFGRRTGLYHFIESRNPDLIQYLEDYETYSPTYYTGDKFLSLAGEDATNSLLSYEIEFLRDEIQNSYSGLMQQTTVENAAEWFLKNFERPANPNQPHRTTQALAIYNQLNGTEDTTNNTNNGSSENTTTSNTTNTTKPSTSTCSENGELDDGEISSFQALVKKYAWPTYQRGNANPTPDYKIALDKHRSEGKYVGGGYTDCGAFVTILLQDSDIDPNYGGGGYTVVQENYVRSQGWKLLNATENTPIDTSILRPGDVAFSEGPVGASGHTFIYVGNIAGFDSNIAAGSLNNHSPMAGVDDLSNSYNRSSVVRWYRKV